MRMSTVTISVGEVTTGAGAVTTSTGSARSRPGPARPPSISVGVSGVGNNLRTHVAAGVLPGQYESVQCEMGRGPCSAGQAIGRSLRCVRSGEGRCAVEVLRVSCLGVPGFRRGGHEAEKRVVREHSRRRYEHRGECGAEQAALAVVRTRGIRFQSMRVMRRTGEQKGEYEDGGER